ncbi:sensor histidine kinase [Pedobacter sp. HDW13]|uniref:sensor histidine kinase n=1 Tax=unclassified Pedobacter TaxID=2628915 RepID=UPI000F5A22C9|nr:MULTISPECIES: ATP-binding protein [unclassified Pedobacter]QIL41413.1 sensor histidine kinase [Pedobacter sp. HDW13]RQO78014.1 two-component sensor histidine kinase [Pedobacter sp. KBW01]
MKLANRYNQVNILTSIVVLIITGIIYYVVIHFILTEKLDRDLAVEENEINQYVDTFHKLPLPANYIDQQISYKTLNGPLPEREFLYTNYFNAKERENEPGRSLITVVQLDGKAIEVRITKSRVESEDLVRIILLITVGITVVLLLSLLLINRFLLNRLWRPFYSILSRMKAFEVTRMDNIEHEPTKIDEFNELNKSVNTMAERVRQDYKELKSFTDNASHEMMTPLAVINSKLDSLLQTESFTAQQGALLEDIYHATGRLSRLHQSLLLLAKIENNLIPDYQNIDLKEMVEAKGRQFQELLEKDGLTLTEKLMPVEIKMSRYLADILLNNLFSNAVRHNVTGGYINIQLNQQALTISNSGKPRQLQTKIFDRFSKSVDSEGMGLGLAITKQICNLYGFRIDYEEEKGEHVFVVYFV